MLTQSTKILKSFQGIRTIPHEPTAEDNLEQKTARVQCDKLSRSRSLTLKQKKLRRRAASGVIDPFVMNLNVSGREDEIVDMIPCGRNRFVSIAPHLELHWLAWMRSSLAEQTSQTAAYLLKIRAKRSLWYRTLTHTIVQERALDRTGLNLKIEYLGCSIAYMPHINIPCHDARYKTTKSFNCAFQLPLLLKYPFNSSTNAWASKSFVVQPSVFIRLNSFSIEKLSVASGVP